MLFNSYSYEILYEQFHLIYLREDIQLLLVTVNNRLKFEIEIVHDLSCDPIVCSSLPVFEEKHHSYVRIFTEIYSVNYHTYCCGAVLEWTLQLILRGFETMQMIPCTSLHHASRREDLCSCLTFGQASGSGQLE